MPKADKGLPDALRAKRRPERPADPMDQTGTFSFDGMPLPEVITRLAREAGIAVTVSPTLPVAEWSQHRVTLRMKGVRRRALFDWLVRPLRAQYAIEAGGGVWISRSNDLLEEEPLEVRSYRVPTHLTSTRPMRGLLVFEREQAAVVETLEACLRYVEERRPGCRIAFHGAQDVLVARLPLRAHRRVAAILDAMRHGTGLAPLPFPSVLDLQAKLDATLDWSTPPRPANHTLLAIAEQADVNLGWDASALGARLVAIPQGKYTVRELLDAVVRQTPLGRYDCEPGHGIWLYLEGQDENYPSSGATPWDRAVVQAYEIRALLPHTTPEALLAHIRKQVDPGDWARGLPAASVFLPTERLIVLHDEAGQRRIAAVLRELAENRRGPRATK
ncbi:MAG TPA: hypothetical protein PLE19_10270 [Planctomycetota bacterium]|nr:hypothetical protein [Planctomycetota bacterium]HRR80285.1 hypothetical protein [Planctomycetota bacterium]HRT95927.1 hypothetical protein [Planctomycetota bacterium]